MPEARWQYVAVDGTCGGWQYCSTPPRDIVPEPAEHIKWRLSATAALPMQRRESRSSTRNNEGQCIYEASHMDNVEHLRALLTPGCDIHWTNAVGLSALHIASLRGHILCARLLIDAGHSLNARNDDGHAPLHCAVHCRQLEMVQLLLDRGAECEIFSWGWWGYTPLAAACIYGEVAIARLLCAHGASRQLALWLKCAESLAAKYGHLELAKWLYRTRHWTPLHYIDAISADRARELLRAGADINESRTENIVSHTTQQWMHDTHTMQQRSEDTTPLSRAREVANLDEQVHHIRDKSAALLILRAAEGWSPANHDLFPAEARARAWDVMRLGYLLSTRFKTGALVDVWRSDVLPRIVSR
jgi:hypothetical protein